MTKPGWARRGFLAGVFLAAWAPAFSQNGAGLVYLGTYTGHGSEGIYAVRFDAATGSVSSPFLAAKTPNPSFVIIHPNGRFVYAVDETRAGSVHAFAIGEGGKLRELNRVSSEGSGPCHLSFDRSGKYVMVANYDSGSIAVFPIEADGSLGAATAKIQHHGSSVNKERQKGPHAHCILPSPDNRFVLVADLGLDEVLVYRFDAAHGMLKPNDPPAYHGAPGAGPRHFVFSPDGKRVYLASEIASTVTALAWDGNRGTLRALQTASLIPANFNKENSAAEITTSPSGKYVYASDRGHDSVSVFAVDAATGRMSLVERAPTMGKTPRNFQIDPAGRYLFAANQDSAGITVFRIHDTSGRLQPTGKIIHVDSPVCVAFFPKQ